MDNPHPIIVVDAEALTSAVVTCVTIALPSLDDGCDFQKDIVDYPLNDLIGVGQARACEFAH
jgi:hypothetical protein